MNLQSEIELVNTRRKLRTLEEDYRARSAETGGDEELREITLESLRRLICQLKEEVKLYEAHQPLPSDAASS